MAKFEGLKASLQQLAGIGLSTAASLSVICIFLFLVHVVFQIEFNCTCSHVQTTLCWTYMILPGVLICLVTLWADKRFRRICGFTCNSCKNCYGDWFACCYNSLPSDGRRIPCKEQNQLNFTEKMSLREQKNTSMQWGFYILAGMLVVIILATWLSQCKGCCSYCCEFIATCLSQCKGCCSCCSECIRNPWKSICSCCSGCCFSAATRCSSNHYLEEFEEDLLEEVEIRFSESLKNISKGYITEKIRDHNLRVLLYEPDASRTSGDESGTRGATMVEWVENVTRTDWEKLSTFTFQVIDDVQAAMNENPRGEMQLQVIQGAAGAGDEEETGLSQSGGETRNLRRNNSREHLIELQDGHPNYSSLP